MADEEAGSELGAKFLVDRYPDLIRAGYVLNEIGGFTVHLGDARFYPIQVAEKGFVTVKMTVNAPPGHGSMPRPGTAIEKMAELITKIVKTPMRQRATPLMERDAEIARRSARFTARAVSPDAVEHGEPDHPARGV